MQKHIKFRNIGGDSGNRDLQKNPRRKRMIGKGAPTWEGGKIGVGVGTWWRFSCKK